MSSHAKLWSIAMIACLGALVLAAFILPHSFQLTAFSDVIQCLLLLSGTAVFVPHALRTEGRMRLFWGMMTLGMCFWLVYQLLWTYFEIVLRKDVPDPFGGDIIIFLHIVPLIAAIAMRPHVPRDEYAARVGRLDFLLLIVWWVYLYVLMVIPWQYAFTDALTYSHNLNAVYLVEKIVFLLALAACWSGSKGEWKTFYANFFGASLMYSASSYLANWAIARNVYYSGSLYDIPLAASMVWVTLIGLWTKARKPQWEAESSSTVYGVWIARGSMIAAFSLPLFAVWTLSDSAVPARIRSVRLLVTLVAALVLGSMVFLRQRLLDAELVRLLRHSRESVENLKVLQAQIIHSEKLASIGQLVGGAAHELNNPITAMLGYSDLLLSTQLTPAQNALATRIGQHVRRTKSLVASLLSFAKQAPPSKTPIDLNTLVRTAVKLTQPQCESLKIDVHFELDSQLPKVFGDSNQLLQVCSQMLGNSLHLLSERGGRTLTILTQQQAGVVQLQIAEDSLAPSGPAAAPMDTLGLSACQGIVQEHRGRLSWEEHAEGTTILVELPGNDVATAVMTSPASLLARSLPSA